MFVSHHLYLAEIWAWLLVFSDLRRPHLGRRFPMDGKKMGLLGVRFKKDRVVYLLLILIIKGWSQQV